MTGTTCPGCGRADTSGANFCASCGHQLRDAADEATDAFELESELPHEEDRARFPHDCGLFVVETGPKAGARYGLEAELTTVGRHGDADILLDDVTVSRRHVEVERVGGATRLEAACRPLLSPGCGVDVTITVPEGTAVDLLTGSGDVDVSGLDGAVAVRTGSGDVEVERLRTQDLTVRSNSGDVEATFARPPFAVKVATGSGDVDLGLPQTRTPYAVDARSESGEVDDAIPATDAQDARVVRVRTQAGDVEVEQDGS